MEKKENFKNFVRTNPGLIKYVKNGEMTWQKFYEIYDLYGEENEAWASYLQKEIKEEKKETSSSTVGDFLTFLKTIDLDSLQESVSSFQRVLGVFGDLTNKKTDTPKEEYKPRPLYKHFDD